MPFAQLPALWWKILIVALALATGVLIAHEAWYGVPMALSGNGFGYTGFERLDRYGDAPDGEGRYWFPVDPAVEHVPFQPDLRLQAGDAIRFARRLDRWRVFLPHEQVALTVLRRSACAPAAGASGTLCPIGPARTVVALPAHLTPMGQVDYWGRLLISVPALLFAVLVASRKPDGHGYRCLALMFLTLGSSFFYAFTLAPPGPLAALAKGLQLTVYDLILFYYIGFVMSYRDYAPTRMRRCLRQVAPVYRAIALFGTLCALGFALGREVPALSVFTRALLGGGVLLAILSLFDGWRTGTGDARQRHLWLLGALGLGSVPAFLTALPALQTIGFDMGTRVVLFFLGQLAMYGLLLYATLKHRVFDFGYVISRLAVKTLSNLLLLLLFLVLEWVLEPFASAKVTPGDLPFVGPVLKVVPALVLYIVFQLSHKRLEHDLAHLLLRRWEENRAALRAWVADAGRIASVDALLASLLAEFQRFGAGAGVAVYLRQREHGFRLAAAAALDDAPPGFDANHELVTKMCSEQGPTRDDALSALGIELALPMCRRGTLLGFVLLSCKAEGEAYRPDEIEALGAAVHQAGLDLRTLRVAQLEQAAHALEERANRQHQVLLATLGRRALALPAGRADGAAGLEASG